MLHVPRGLWLPAPIEDRFTWYSGAHRAGAPRSVLPLQQLVSNQLDGQTQERREDGDHGRVSYEDRRGDSGPVAEGCRSGAKRLPMCRDQNEADDTLENRFERSERRSAPRPLPVGVPA